MTSRKPNCAYHCGNYAETNAKYNDFCAKVTNVLVLNNGTLLPDKHNVGFSTCGTSGGYWRIQRDRRVGHFGNLQVATSRNVCSACFGFLNKALLLTKNHFRTAHTFSTSDASSANLLSQETQETREEEIDLPATLPESFICPINGTLMRNPVMCTDGHSYEKCAIDEWFKRSNKSPLTNVPISTILIPNITLRKSIEEFIEIHKKSSRNESSETTS